MIINLVLWAVFGGLAGWIASHIMHTENENGVIANIFLGIAGAIVGGMILRALIGRGISGFNIGSLAVAIFGSILLLAVFRTFVRN